MNGDKDFEREVVKKSATEWKVFGAILALVYAENVMAVGSNKSENNLKEIHFQEEQDIDDNELNSDSKPSDFHDQVSKIVYEYVEKWKKDKANNDLSKNKANNKPSEVMSLKDLKEYLSGQNLWLQEVCKYILKGQKPYDKKRSIAAEKLQESLIYNTNFIDENDVVGLVLANQQKKFNQIKAFRNRVFGTLKDFIEAGAKEYSLHYACEKGNLEYVKIFMRLGADVNEGDNNGKTPLCYACESGDLNLVEYLVDRGANVNDRLSLRNARKGTFNRIVKYLISKGARDRG